MNTRFYFRAAAVAVMATTLHATAWCEERGTQDEAKAMVDAAYQHVKKVGPEKAYADFGDKSNAEWHKKDVYVFVYSMDGVGLAHGTNPKLVGKSLIDMKDQNGKLFVQDMRDTARKGAGWINYDWVHPVTNKIEGKTTYIRRIDGSDTFVGAGVYR